MVIQPDPFSVTRDRRRGPPFPGWTRRNRGGLWLPEHRFPGYCCCEEKGECICNFGDNDCTIPAAFIIDLAAGGWIDGNCDCDPIAGEFTAPWVGDIDDCRLIPNSFCHWVYLEENYCDTAFLQLSLVIQEWGLGLVNWQYHLAVDLWKNFSSYSRADYYNTKTDNTDCLNAADGDGKITLSRTVNIHLGFLCSGTLPATIKIWPETWPP